MKQAVGRCVIWTADEQSVLRVGVELGVSREDIAAKLPGRTLKAVEHQLVKLGIHVPKVRVPSACRAPEGFVELSAQLGEKDLRERFRCGGKTLRRWREETGAHARKPKVVAPVRKKATRFVRFGRPLAAPDTLIDTSTAALAARHLQRLDYRPVCRRVTIDTKSDKDLWQVGRAVLSSADMIAKAENLGFGERRAA